MGYWTKSKKWAQIYLFLLLLLFFSPLKWKKLPLFFENGPNLSLNNISSAKKIIIITTWTVTQAPLFFIFFTVSVSLSLFFFDSQSQTLYSRTRLAKPYSAQGSWWPIERYPLLSCFVCVFWFVPNLMRFVLFCELKMGMYMMPQVKCS